MATLAMPSATFPAPPAVSVEVPDSWQPQLSSGALMDVVFAADPQAGRLIVRHLVPASPDLVDEVVEGFRAETERQGGISDQPFEVSVDGRAAQAFNAADDRTPTSTACAVALGFFEGPERSAEARGDGPVSGLLIIGEACGSEREDRYAEIRDMVLSASFGRLVLEPRDTTDPDTTEPDATDQDTTGHTAERDTSEDEEPDA